MHNHIKASTSPLVRCCIVITITYVVAGKRFLNAHILLHQIQAGSKINVTNQYSNKGNIHIDLLIFAISCANQTTTLSRTIIHFIFWIQRKIISWWSGEKRENILHTYTNTWFQNNIEASHLGSHRVVPLFTYNLDETLNTNDSDSVKYRTSPYGLEHVMWLKISSHNLCVIKALQFGVRFCETILNSTDGNTHNIHVVTIGSGNFFQLIGLLFIFWSFSFIYQRRTSLAFFCFSTSA
jgi:hypothetical protein